MTEADIPLRAEREETRRAVNERLDHFLTLQRDWDSYGAEPPIASCVAAARWLAHTLIASGAAIENIEAVPTSEGEIELHWKLNDTDIEVIVWASPLGEYDPAFDITPRGSLPVNEEPQ